MQMDGKSCNTHGDDTCTTFFYSKLNKSTCTATNHNPFYHFNILFVGREKNMWYPSPYPWVLNKTNLLHDFWHVQESRKNLKGQNKDHIVV